MEKKPKPDPVFQGPTDKDFGEAEFIPAPDIRDIERLCFESIREAHLVYLWKRIGAEKPRRILGKCRRPSGLLAFFSGADFVVWLAANNCQGLTKFQMEALVFHELKHAAILDGKPVSIPHDWEGFAEEIQRYGLWKMDMVPIGEAVCKTLKLPFAEEQPVGDGVRAAVEKFRDSIPAGGSVTVTAGGKSVTLAGAEGR